MCFLSAWLLSLTGMLAQRALRLDTLCTLR
jgi:hypothetical protein